MAKLAEVRKVFLFPSDPFCQFQISLEKMIKVFERITAESRGVIKDRALATTLVA